jgi:hypothetical protein
VLPPTRLSSVAIAMTRSSGRLDRLEAIAIRSVVVLLRSEVSKGTPLLAVTGKR